jgi:hypothetical protein
VLSRFVVVMGARLQRYSVFGKRPRDKATLDMKKPTARETKLPTVGLASGLAVA